MAIAELKPINPTGSQLDFTTSEIDKLVEKLKKGRLSELPDVEKLKKSYLVENHDVFDKNKRKDKPKKKKIKAKEEEEDELSGLPRTVEKDKIVDDGFTPVNRIGHAEEMVIVNQAVAFAAGNPVDLTCNPSDDKEKDLFSRLTETFEDNKIDAFNRKAFRSIFAFREVAECWYHVKSGDGWKLRVMRFAPELGDKLYPYFDEYNDMIAFSREFTMKDADDEDITYLITYTTDIIYTFIGGSGKWTLFDNQPNVVGKITIIYGWQERADYEIVNHLIARREILRSNFADTIDYNASPKIVATGKVNNFIDKGDGGGIIELGENAKVDLLTWDQAPEAVKLEDDLLLQDIYRLTDTADLSFNKLISLGSNISGETLRRMLTSPIQKVYRKKEYLDEYVQRRVNLVKAYLGVIYPDLKEASKTLRIKAEIVPLQLEDYDEFVDRLKKENGGKPIKSQAQTVRELLTRSGASEDVIQKALDELGKESASKSFVNDYDV